MVDIVNIQRVSVSVTGEQADGDVIGSGFSPDGSKVFFYGSMSLILSSGVGRGTDVAYKDLNTGQVFLVSSTAAGVAGNSSDIFSAVSDDGNVVVFKSSSTNFVANDTASTFDVYAKNLTTGAVTLISQTQGGVVGNAASGGSSYRSDISPDSNLVAFETLAKNLVAGDTGVLRDIVIKNIATGALTTVSQSASGVLSNGNSFAPVFSPDGTKVIFHSTASNLLTTTDNNGTSDVFLKDLTTGVVTRLSTDASGTQANGASIIPFFSNDGTKIIFASTASNLVSGDTNGVQDIFVKNLATGVVTLVSTSASGGLGNADSTNAVFSPDGTKVAFLSSASNLVSGDTNTQSDVFVKDLVDGSIIRVNTSMAGAQANNFSFDNPFFSNDGTKLIFTSAATNLVSGVTTTHLDTYVVTLAGNRAVVVGDDSLAVSEGGQLNNVAATLLANDADPEGQAFSITSVDTTGTKGTVTFVPATHQVSYAADGTFIDHLAQGATLNDHFTYTVTDAFGNVSTATVNVAVAGVNDTPIAVNDAVVTDEDVSLIISKASLLANDTDVDNGSVLSISGISVNPAHGTLVDNGDGTYTYTAAANFHGDDAFTYTMTDQFGATSTATASITINSVNDAPVGGADSVTVIEGQTSANLVSVLLANDSDVEGEALSISSVTTLPTLGQVTFDAQTQSLSYSASGAALDQLAQGETGVDSFTYRVRDASGAVRNVSVAVNVTGVNDVPVANADSLLTDEDVSLIISKASLLGNDVDVDHGAVLNVVDITAAVQHGTLVDNGDGTYTYTSDANYHGADVFTYTMADEFGAISSATASITINSVNDAPVAVADVYTVDEDSSVVITKASLLANDSDVDAGAVLSISGVAVNPAAGALVDNGDGTYTYTPNANFHGSDAFTYTLTDELGATTTAVANITVNSVNDTPVAMDDAFTTDEDVSLVIPVASLLANDTDADTGAVLSFAGIVGTAAHGTLVDNGDGTLTYTGNANFNGTDAFTYSATDEFGVTTTATANITVNPVNDVPVAVDEDYTTDEDTSLIITKASLLANDSDVDAGAVLSIANIAVNPVAGTLVDNGDGTYTYTPNANFSTRDDVVTVQGFPVNDDSGVYGNAPNAGFHGVDSFVYTVTDEHGAITTATAHITVNPVNDAPVAVDDAFTMDEDTSLIITKASLLANDSDVDIAAHLSISGIAVNPAAGTLVDNGNDTYTYTPNANFHGSDAFTYTLTDEVGATTTAVANITVNVVNDAPVAVDDTFTVDEDNALIITKASLLANDSDSDTGAVLSIANIAVNPAAGTLVDNGNDTYTYTPNANFHGSDAFTYTLTDEVGATTTAVANITVNSVNDVPVANADAFSLNAGEALSGLVPLVLANDSDADGDALQIVSIDVGNYEDSIDGRVEFNQATQSLSYTADHSVFTQLRAGDITTESFRYTVRDAAGAESTATATFTVTGLNDAPVANADVFATNEDAALIISKASLLANDRDIDGMSVLSISGIAVNPAAGTLVDNGNNTYTYTPNANFHGSDVFTYTLTDELGATSTATASITVNSVNDAPVANVDTLFLAPSQVVTNMASLLLANDTDGDGDALQIVSVDLNSTNGPVEFNAQTGVFTYSATDGIFIQLQEGDVETDSITYTIRDASGLESTNVVNIIVAGVDDAPVAYADAFVTDQNVPLIISKASLLANDTDVDAGTTLSVAGIAVNPAAGTLVDNGDGTYTYTANANFYGSDAFTYTLTDEHGLTSTAAVAITVNQVNATPVAVDDTLTINEDEVAVITFASLLANDTDADATDALSIDSVVTGPTHGALVDNGAGAWVYTPVKDYFGNDSFVYRITDGHGGFAQATMNITLLPMGESIVGTNAADTLIGSDQDDTIKGLQGDDLIQGLGGNDSLDGGSGKDTVDAGDGNDTLIGGSGEDSLLGGNGHDLLNGGAENDTLYGGAGLDTLNGGSENDTLYGGDDNDRLNGDTGSDLLYGENGNDILNGNDGNDTIYAGEGLDKITAGLGDDVIYAEAGNDTISGNEGNDSIVGGDGNDRINGDDGNDTLLGGNGVDSLLGGLGDDSVDAGADNDSVISGDGNDTIHAGTGNDTIYAQLGDDLVYGEDGNDRITADFGKDTIYGGAGNDTIEGGGTGATDDVDNDVIYGEDGNDLVFGDEGDDTITGDGGNDTLYGGLGNDSITAGVGLDTIYGDDGNDTVYAGADNDRIYGGAGNDLLYAEAGSDRVEAGDGDDTVYGGEGGDRSGDRIYGDAGNDLLFGGSGVDTLLGGEGGDTLNAGGNRDSLYGEAGADIFRFTSLTDSTTAERDQIYDYVDGADKIDVHGLGFSGITTGNVAGQLHVAVSGGNTIITDTASTFAIALTGNHLASLDNSDFIF